jgi:O-antigen ligase
MASTKTSGNFFDVMAARWILGSLLVTNLYFQLNVADPFNSPKMWVLLLFSAWLFGYVVAHKSILISSRDLKISTYIIFGFLIACSIATLTTDLKYIAIFGDTQRRNGFISYLSLCIIFLATIMFIRLYNIMKLFFITYLIAIITIVYGLMQTTGHDFVDWVNPHNSLIGTQGNPNFASAVMAIMGVITLSSIFISNFSHYQRFIAILICTALLFLIYRSNARQGLLSIALGAGIFLIIWIFGINRKLGIISLFFGFTLFLFSVMGMLQVGPLQHLLYKPSVSVRGFYWRAGIEMLKNNLLTGVGMDRYGAYFMQYREVGYPLSYGFEITSSNAHNTFIQFFATGGILLGLSYLILTIWIFTRAIKGLRKLAGNDKLILAGVFSSWIAFHAQSFISIDNLGISIWGWILGGAIIGISSLDPQQAVEKRNLLKNRPTDINLIRVSSSGISTILAILLIAVLFRAENNTYNSAVTFNKQDQAAISAFRESQLKVINSPLIDLTYSLRAAQNLIQYGLTEDGLTVLESIYKKDPRNLDAINFLALTFENYNQIDKAIIYREKMTALNPWNAPNYLALGIDYKKTGNSLKSQEMLNKILSFSTGVNGDPIAEQAKKELSQ